MKENDLSVKIVISTGRIVSWPCVRALNSLQKAMMLMPCGPSAVPTGGAGLAFPAGIWSFTKPDTFFAITLLSFTRRQAGLTTTVVFTSPWLARGRRSRPVRSGEFGVNGGRCVWSPLTHHSSPPYSVALQLQVIQLHRRRATEQAHRDADLPLVGHHFLDRPVEIGERSLGDRHGLPDEEGDLLLRHRLLDFVSDAEQTVDLFRAERLREPLVPDELDHALDAVDGVQRLLRHHHLHEHVAREDLPLHRDLLAVLDLHDFLRGHESLTDRPLLRGPRIRFDLSLDERADLVLVSRSRLDRVEAVVHWLSAPRRSREPA